MNGFLNIYKPKGITSHDAVYIVRKKLKTKTGHLGTLDPMAEGVLPVALGCATRLIEFLPPQKKTYLAQVTLGIHTDTLDITGNILRRENPEVLDASFLAEVLNSFLGISAQTPPKYSALKVYGEKAYDLARKNIDFLLSSREIEIFSIKLVNYEHPNFTFRAETSPGTYIRSLCEDIGKKINQPAVLSGLVREKSGCFFMEDSIDMKLFESLTEEEIKNRIVSIDEVFLNLPKLIVKNEFEAKILNGVILKIEDFENNSLNLKNKEKIFIYNPAGAFTAAGEIIIDKDIKVKPIKVFNRNI